MRSHPACRSPLSPMTIKEFILVIRTDEIISVAGSEYNLANRIGTSQIKARPTTGRLGIIERSIRITVKHIRIFMGVIKPVTAGSTDNLPFQRYTVSSRRIESNLRDITVTILRAIIADIPISTVTIYSCDIPEAFREFFNDKQGVLFVEIRIIAALTPPSTIRLTKGSK